MKTMDISKLRRLSVVQSWWATKSLACCRKKKLTKSEAIDSIEYLAWLAEGYRKYKQHPDLVKYLDSVTRSLLAVFHRTWKDNPDYRR